ncbi:MAG: hypothetical protein SOV95_04930 [Anaerovibrio sp.]|nr:hypothetical protein [Anaerovibrio sp.]MDD7677908.1 hypothetical protein [Anaerovibrio sp.]MDY2603598.1 hypothetical protein [Anaerovibrio sp.]
MSLWGVCSRISGDGLNVYMRQVLEKIQAEYASRLSISGICRNGS